MARSFNGSSDKIVNAGGVSGGPQNGSTAFTSCAWAYIISDGGAGATPCYFAYGRNALGYSFQMSWKQSLTAWMVENQFPNSDIQTTSSVNYSIGTWTHILQTLSGTTITIYVNGVNKGTSNPGITWGRVGANNTVSFGNDFCDSANFANCRVAHAALWGSTVLTQGEITALAAGALPYTIRPALLTGYWPLDGLQSPEPDLSGNAFNGTLTGTASAAGPPAMMFTPRWPQNSLSALSTGTAFNPAWAMGSRLVDGGIGI